MNYPDICTGCKKKKRVEGKKKCQECLDKDNLKSSSRFREKADRGECYYCQSPAVDGGRMCQHHLDLKRSYNKDRRKNGCDKCGRPKEKGCLCLSCWEKRTAYLKQRNDKVVVQKLCRVCSAPALEGVRLCETCRSNLNQLRADRKLLRQQLGLCITCGKESSGNKCVNCYLKETAHFHLKQRKLYPKLIEILNGQNGVCPYTGEKLILGQNTTLDHKIPKSRGGTSDISNLQWVYKGEFDVNWMKGMMTEEEFLEAIEKIHRYLIKTKGH